MPEMELMMSNLLFKAALLVKLAAFTLLSVTAAPANAAAQPPPLYDVLIRRATIYDGSGGAPLVADLAVNQDKIVNIGNLQGAKGRLEIDAQRLALAPGFINVLSWATESLIADGRSLSDIKQGITLEIFGEGISMGPLNHPMKEELLRRQSDIRFPVEWTTLGEYLQFLERRGVSPNIASFIGATTVRIHELGYADRAPSAAELDRMRALVAQGMREGALGLASALIYAPAFYARPEELVALAKVASSYGGMYMSHLRSESGRFLESLDELIHLSQEARIPAEVYHLKAAGQANWPKLDQAIARIEAARRSGLRISANMYTYTAAATGLDAAMPPWVQEGGNLAWAKRLTDPAIRQRVQREMRTPSDTWENFYLAAGSPDNILLVGFATDALKPLTGKTLAQVAKARGCSPEEAAMALVVEDQSRVEAVYFLMSEENVRKQIALPWVSFGSDAPSLAPEEPFRKSNPHPRAYGNVARLLGRYVRDEKIVGLSEAVRRLTSLPAQNLKLAGRGKLAPGYFADLVIFDPAKVQDHATYEQPHQYSSGVLHVFVNGQHVLRDGEHTGAKPGRVLRGPGYTSPPK
jgi:N-acyl-D-amino-acid deacylase